MMKQLVVLRVICWLLSLGWGLLAFAAPITTQLSRSPVALGETFEITYIVDQSVADATPDFSPLQKDFNILGTGKNSQFTMINGKTRSVTQWEVVLSARRMGELTIPAIAFGDQTSESRRIKVLDGQQMAEQGQPQDVFMEVTVEAEHPYVQSQVIYAIRLYTAADIVNANLSLPEADNALFIRLGDDWRYSAERYGRLYQVVERRYAMFPEASRELTIYAPTFSGISVNTNASSLNPFFDRAFARPVQIQGPTRRLDILPIPAEYTASHWLPARQVTLQESWAEDKNKARVGEPITRTVTLRAQGVTVAQLPALNAGKPTNVSIYPDKPVTENKLDDGNIVAEKTQKVVYIPNEAGEVELPAVQVSWWNILTQKMEKTRLPAVRLDILPASSATPASGQPPATSKPVALNDASTVDVTAPAALEAESVPVTQSNAVREMLPWIIAASFALLWLVTVMVWWLWQRRIAKSPAQNKPASQTKQAKTALAALKQACKRNNPGKAREQLLVWGKLQWPTHKITSISQIADHCQQAELAAAIAGLNKALYQAQANGVWQGDDLWAAVQLVLARQSSQSSADNDAALPPLYLQ
jgi:BatD DUF11 like domain